MKALIGLLILSLISAQQVGAYARSDQDSARLEKDIRDLRGKIRSSKEGVSSRDLERLTRLENQLQKSKFLKNKGK